MSWADPSGVFASVFGSMFDSAVAPPSSGASQYTYTTGNTASILAAPPRGAITMKHLESEAFNAPIERLIDLWLTRYGNEWVDLEAIENDEFFGLAYKRLKSLGQLETHYLTDRARFVCRKPE